MVSVAMCTYNGAPYIQEQLKSILTQTVLPDEIIICDDISSDDTVKLAKEILTQNPINFILQINKIQLGVTKNFEKALELCSGEYVFLCDQDDIWVNNKVEMILKVFKEKPNCNVVFTNAYLADAEGNILKKDLWKTIKFREKENYFIENFLGKRFVTGATVALKKKFYNKIIPFPDCWIHDAWIAINASIDNSIYSLPQKTIYYRQHSNNVIGCVKKSVYQRIKFRLFHIKHIYANRFRMKERFEVFLTFNNNKLQEKEKEIVKRCEKFWNEMVSLENNKFTIGIKIIIKNQISGNYKKYHTGILAFSIDVLAQIVKSLKKDEV